MRHIVSRDYIPYSGEPLTFLKNVRNQTMTNEEMDTPLGDQPPEFKPEDWHYIENGIRKGPISSTAIKKLISANTIGNDAPVWRKGMSDWKEIRETELADAVASEPPAVAPSLIGNGYAWMLALPLALCIISAGLESSNHQAVFSHSNNPSKGFPAGLSFAINGLFVLLDLRRLKTAGYNFSKALGLLGFLLTPLYLFIRAHKLKQTPWYAIACVVLTLTGLMILASASADQ
jgi:hypothetical protein